MLHPLNIKNNKVLLLQIIVIFVLLSSIVIVNHSMNEVGTIDEVNIHDNIENNVNQIIKADKVFGIGIETCYNLFTHLPGTNFLQQVGH